MDSQTKELGTLFDYADGSYAQVMTANEATIDEAAEEAHEWRCPSCGAVLILFSNEATKDCPYCQSRLVALEKLSGVQEPAGIIPFEYTLSQATSLVKQAYPTKGALLAASFKPQIGKGVGVYIPFYLYSCDYSITLLTEGTDSDNHETYRTLSASSRFNHIPIDASRSMPDSAANALLPINHKDVMPFDYRYLLGFAVELPNESHEACEKRLIGSLQRCFAEEESFVNILRGDSSRTTIVDESIIPDNVECMLYPAYLFNVVWDGKNHLVAISGKTGKIASAGTSLNTRLAKALKYAAAAAGVLVACLLTVLLGALLGATKVTSAQGLILFPFAAVPICMFLGFVLVHCALDKYHLNVKHSPTHNEYEADWQFITMSHKG